MVLPTIDVATNYPIGTLSFFVVGYWEINGDLRWVVAIFYFCHMITLGVQNNWPKRVISDSTCTNESGNAVRTKFCSEGFFKPWNDFFVLVINV